MNESINQSGGGGGVLLGILGILGILGRAVAGSLNPDHFRPKHAIFHTRFQTWSLKFIPVFRPGLWHNLASHQCRSQELSKFTRKFSSNDIFWILLFLYFSFGVEKINTFIRSSGSLENHTRFNTITVKIYTRSQTKTAQKPYPLGRHMPISLI